MNTSSPLKANTCFYSGARAIDHPLGGFARGVVHELYADHDQQVAASAFGLMLACRADAERKIVLIRGDYSINTSGRCHADGVEDVGIDSRRLVVVHAANTVSVLRAAVDAIACCDIGSVLVETGPSQQCFDLLATRRLALGSRRSGVVTMLIRSGSDPVPSAAMTRWSVASARSRPEGTAPGRPTFDLKLLRHRGGIAEFAAKVEWDREQYSFFDTPISGAIPSTAVGRTNYSLWRSVA